MSQYIQQQCRRAALLFLALGFALPAAARDIVEVSANLFFTRDERAGIQMPDPDGVGLPTGFANIDTLYTLGSEFGTGVPIFASGQLGQACDSSMVVEGLDRSSLGLGPGPVSCHLNGIFGFGPHLYNKVTTPLAVDYDQNDFTESSVSQFRDIGIALGREAVRTQIRPMLAAWVYDVEEDTYTIADRALGPMLADRPQTLGKGRFSMGWSYQRIDWTRYQGQNLSQFNIRVDHQDSNGDGILTGQETDFIDVTLDYQLSQNYIDFFFEYGVTNDLDVSIAIPVVQTNLKIKAFAGKVQQRCGPPSELNNSLPPEFCNEPGLDPNVVAIYEAFQDSGLYPTVQLPGVGRAIISPLDGQQWNKFWSRQSHSFCNGGNDRTFYSLNSPSTGTDCPGGDSQPRKGDRAETFFGDIADEHEEKAIGIGDVRIRAKWHPIKANGFIPDLAWVAEIRPPTGKEDDYMGTGAFSTSNYLVGAWALGPFRPHFNVGLEISAGPSWQDSTQWAFGFEWLLTDWLSVSFDQLGRVPFGDKVARRYDYGGGLKFIPTPGVGLFFDFVKPINVDEGLTADLTWRIGGQILF